MPNNRTSAMLYFWQYFRLDELDSVVFLTIIKKNKTKLKYYAESYKNISPAVIGRVA